MYDHYGSIDEHQTFCSDWGGVGGWVISNLNIVQIGGNVDNWRWPLRHYHYSGKFPTLSVIPLW